MPNWGLGRTGQLYVGEEATYGTAPVLAGANALRHLSINLHYDPKALAKSPERHTHPSQAVLLQRRAQASFDLKAQFYPSGTLNTLPEADLLLKNSLGAAATNTTLATTVASGPSTTGATLASGAGLAVGQHIEINIAAGGNAGTYMRTLLTVAGAAVTWAPALPAAPLVGDTAKGVATYGLGTALPKSLDIAHYPQAPASGAPTRELLGCVCDKFSFMVDGNSEPQIQVSGPAQMYAASPQAQPGAFTTVGAESAIPSGLSSGYFYHNGTLYQVEKFQLDIVNGMDLQNTAIGTSKAVAYFRKSKRAVTVKFDAKVSDDLTVWTPSLAQSGNPLFLQIGGTNGRIWSIYCPNVFLNLPDTPDGDETNNWSFQGTALSSAAAGNDEVTIAQG
jgi:hypothetical protein